MPCIIHTRVLYNADESEETVGIKAKIVQSICVTEVIMAEGTCRVQRAAALNLDNPRNRHVLYIYGTHPHSGVICVC
jgi:hypothetical protein